MLYEPNEIKTSEEQLEKIFNLLRGPICLLGGWAIYYIVNRNFEKANGRKYIGSRDIDIGFHMNKDWTEEHLRESQFTAAIKAIESTGFSSIGSRLFKDFDIDTGKELTPKESSKLPTYQIFRLFIDPIVDNIHPKTKDLLGFIPIDEPLLSLVFQNKMHVLTTLFKRKILLPTSYVLLAMKLNSAPARDKENKRIKDIADIYALLWYSNIELPKLKDHLFSIYPKERTKNTMRGFTKKEIEKVSSVIGTSSQEISRVFAELS